MNKAKLLELAKKSQLQYGSDEEPLISVVKFAELVRADEREACAQTVERMGIAGYGTLAIAGAIRVRREQ